MEQKYTPLKKIPTLTELKTLFPQAKSHLFDMDGTLFNTEKYHALSLIMMAQKYRIVPPYPEKEVHALMMGKADYLVFDIIREWPGVPEDWEVQHFIEEKNLNLLELLSRTKSQDFFPDNTRKLLHEIKDSGDFLGLVTSSEEVITNELLKLAGIHDLFEIKLTRDNCPKHKPDPWPYLKAIELSSYQASETIIYEDSLVGLTAATGALGNVIKVEWF